MESLWSLGGLSIAELLRRSARESWQDSVFGQGGRMAFYQFLALVPSLVVFLVITSHVPRFGSHVSAVVHDLTGQFLPDRVAMLLQEITNDLSRRPLSGKQLIMALAGTLWPALNSTWAMVYGLNRAYEVEERRSWWRITVIIVGLTFIIAAIGTAAVFLLVGGAYLEQHLQSRLIPFGALEWIIAAVSVSLFLAVLYRFAPNVPDPEWRWSTPGALFAVIIWIGSVFAARFYFEQVNDYSRIYGYLNGVAILLIWLYVSNGAILIGGELNSEIEKAAGERSRGLDAKHS